jgi:outer membrane cobalamin receptor
MVRIRSFPFIAAALLAGGVGARPLYAQIGDPSATQPGLLIVINGVELRSVVGAEQDSLLRAIAPAIQAIEVLKGPGAVLRYGAAASDGAVVITLKSDFACARQGPAGAATRDDVAPELPDPAAPLLIIDGVVVSSDGMPRLDPQDIELVQVIKGAEARELFGERAAGGVIQIRRKPRQHLMR